MQVILENSIILSNFSIFWKKKMKNVPRKKSMEITFVKVDLYLILEFILK